jgi:hypothetical protein
VVYVPNMSIASSYMSNSENVRVLPELKFEHPHINRVFEWPELVGMNGDQAVEIIKQQTGRLVE